MAAVVLAGGPPIAPATPVLLTATPADSFGPLGVWTALPVGLWFIRLAVASSPDANLLTDMSAFSNELSFTVAPPATDSAIVTWTVDGSWPAGHVMLVFISQVPDYFGAPSVVATAADLAYWGLFGAPLASVGTATLAAFTGTQHLQQNFLTDFTTPFLPDTPQNRWDVSGGTDGDPITTPDVVAAIRAAGETVEELDPAGSHLYGFLRNSYLVERGIHFTGGVWKFGNEDLTLAGTLKAATGTEIRFGDKLGDGSRVDGPTLSMHAANPATEAVDPDWSGKFTLYAGAYILLHDRLSAAIGGADPDPTNDWMHAAPKHDRATSVDPPNISRMTTDADGETYTLQAMRFANMTALQLQAGVAVPVYDFDAVGFHDVGEFIIAAASTVERCTMENCLRGFGILLAHADPQVDIILDRCRVVGYRTSVLYWIAGNPRVTLLDFTSDEDADGDDPTITLSDAFLTLGGNNAPRIQVAHRFNVKVVDYLGVGVSGATVTLLDGTTVIISEATDANGDITEQQLARYIYDDADAGPSADTTGTLTELVAAGWLVLVRSPPYTMVVERAGFENEVLEVDPDQPMALVVTNHATRVADIEVALGADTRVAATVEPMGITASIEEADLGATIEHQDVEGS